MSRLTLEERLDRWVSVEEIIRLKYEYAAYCDDNYNPEGIVSLFTDDAVWEGTVNGRYEGKEEIAAYFARIPGSNLFASHLMLNPVIDVDADHATGRWWLLMPCTLRDDTHEARGHWHLAHYLDDYVRVDGRWLFKHMRVIQHFFSPVGEDWAAQTLNGVKASGQPHRLDEPPAGAGGDAMQ